MAGKYSKLDNWRVFHMALCVLLCWQWEDFDQWRQLLINNANCTSDCANLSSRCAMGIFENFLLLNLCAPLWLFYAFYASIYRTPNLMRPVKNPQTCSESYCLFRTHLWLQNCPCLFTFLNPGAGGSKIAAQTCTSLISYDPYGHSTFLNGVGLFNGATDSATIFSNSGIRCPYSLRINLNLVCNGLNFTCISLNLNTLHLWTLNTCSILTMFSKSITS